MGEEWWMKNPLQFLCETKDKGGLVRSRGVGILSAGPRAPDFRVEAQTLRLTFEIHYQFMGLTSGVWILRGWLSLILALNP